MAVGLGAFAKRARIARSAYGRLARGATAGSKGPPNRSESRPKSAPIIRRASRDFVPLSEQPDTEELDESVPAGRTLPPQRVVLARENAQNAVGRVLQGDRVEVAVWTDPGPEPGNDDGVGAYLRAGDSAAGVPELVGIVAGDGHGFHGDKHEWAGAATKIAVEHVLDAVERIDTGSAVGPSFIDAIEEADGRVRAFNAENGQELRTTITGAVIVPRLGPEGGADVYALNLGDSRVSVHDAQGAVLGFTLLHNYGAELVRKFPEKQPSNSGLQNEVTGKLGGSTQVPPVLRHWYVPAGGWVVAQTDGTLDSRCYEDFPIGYGLYHNDEVLKDQGAILARSRGPKEAIQGYLDYFERQTVKGVAADDDRGVAIAHILPRDRP